MKTSSTMVFLGTSALTGALLVGTSAPGCGGDTVTPGHGANTTTSQTTNTGGGGGGTGGSISATAVTIQQITDPSAPGHVGLKTPVQIKGAVAMTTKFLVSKSGSGNCLWGVFLSSPNLTETAPNTGILAVSYGTPAQVSDGGTTAFCPVIQANQPAGDSFPDDVKPGDVLDVTGVADSFIPSQCSGADAGPGASTVAGFQLSKVTAVTRTGTAPLPKTHVLTSADVDKLAAGTDATWLNQWGNVKVEVDDVTVENQLGQLTDNYGHMLLQLGANGLEVGDKLYYVGYVKGSDACYSGPYYTTVPPFQLSSVSGFVYLDFCNWSLAPASKCHDLVPPSADCVNAMMDGGADAAGDAGPNPAMTCLH